MFWTKAAICKKRVPKSQERSSGYAVVVDDKNIRGIYYLGKT